MDFKNSNGVRKLKRFCMTCIEFLRFSFDVFWFQSEFLFYSDFHVHKTHLKSFVFENLLIGDCSSTFISLMTKFEVYKFEHVENDIHFCQDI